MKLLLIVLGTRACWFREEDGQWSQPFEEAPGTPDADGQSQSRCPYLPSSGAQVELVLDSGFQEVEMRTLVQGSSWLANRLDCRAVRHRICHENPDASARLVRLPSGRDAISITQILPQPELQAWLSGLRGVMFTSIRSMSDLLARRSGAPFDRARGAYLYVLHDSRACRHLLFLSGQLCLARLVPTRDEAAVLPAVEDTVDHLLANGVDTQGLVLHTLGLSIDAQQRLTGAVRCAGQTSLDSPTGQALTLPLAQWVASLTDPGRSVLSAGLAYFEPEQSGFEPMSQRPLGTQSRDSVRQDPSQRSLGRLTQNRETQSQATVSFDRLLDPWRAVLKAVRRLGLCMAGGFVLSIALWLTGTEAFDRWQAEVAGLERARQLRTQIDGLREQAGLLHGSPVAAERSLLRRQAFASAMAWQPRHWLGTLASAITAHEPIVIDSLEWSLQPQVSAGIGTPSVEREMVPAAFDRAGHWRESVPIETETRDSLQVHLSGYLDAAMPLREQRDQLAAFVTTLEALPGNSAVRIDRSPIDDYAGGRRQLPRAAQPEAAATAQFTLHLLFHPSETRPSP